MFGDQVSIGSLTPLAIQEYFYFIEIKLFKNYSNFNIEVIESYRPGFILFHWMVKYSNTHPLYKLHH